MGQRLSRQFVTFQDGTRYRITNINGTLVRDPKKVNGRIRKRNRKAAHRAQHQT